MAKRGFFAELNHQAQLAEKKRRQQQAAAFRAQAAAEREADRARKAAERARASAARVAAADQKAAEKEAARLHVEAKLAEVASLNAEVEGTVAEIEGLLAWTLEVDDYVELENLRTTVEHPRFESGRLGTPGPRVPDLVYPPEPVYQEPPMPGSIGAAFGGRKRHEQAVEQARRAFDAARREWHELATAMHTQHVADLARYEDGERRRLAQLAAAEAAYRKECEQREALAAARNAELSAFINELAFDVESAIDEYVGIVLSNSVYPSSFPVSHAHSFTLETRELTLVTTLPEPSAMPSVKEYRYVKAKDEIVATPLTSKVQKDRYAEAVWQVAVRTLHEVFEADRAGKIHSITLTVGVDRGSPATGLPETVPLVRVAADRETFRGFDLANVVPQATLVHLGAALSKSPFDLAPADTSRGVRVRGQA